MSEQVPSLGIDFGTTNSCMAWYDPRTRDSQVILNAEGQHKTPSLVYFGDGEIMVGEPVEALIQDVSTNKARREEVFARTITSVKRNLLSPPRIALPGGRYVRPVEVAAEVLKKLKRDAEEGLFHEEVPRAIITCPAEFNVLQRKHIEEAGRLAGFREVALLEEPVAGALAYARAGLDVGRHVLVYDLGGGTFDLAVLDNEDESFHVAMEPKGVERCGGDDFDVALYHHCDEVARENLGRPISLTGAVDLSFLRACRRRKEGLTFQERGRFNNYLSSENGPVLFEHEVDRKTFEGLIGGYVETTARLTEEILKQADAAGHEVDTVVLVGGSVRVPLVGRTLKETLPANPLNFDKKDVAIALGAAHYTNIRWAPQRRARRTEAVTEIMQVTHLDRYRSVVEEAFADGRLDKVEADRLNSVARQLGLSREQTAEAERQVMGNSKEGVLFQQYRSAVERVWADEKVHPLEAEWLDALAGEFGLTRAQTSYAQSKVMGSPKEELLSREDHRPRGAAESFALVHTLTGHSEEVNAVAFDPDGRLLVSGSSDHRVMGWDVRTGRPVGALARHTGKVSSVAFSPDGRYMASGGFDKTARVCKLPNGEPFHTFNHADWIFCVAFGPGGRLVAGDARGGIRVWSLKTGESILALQAHSYWVLSVSFSLDGRFLFGGGADGTLRVWESETGETLRVLEHPAWVTSLAPDPGGRFVVVGCGDGGLRAWEPRTGEPLWSVGGHLGAVYSVALSHDGQALYTAGADRKVKAWDPRTGTPLHLLSGCSGAVKSAVPSPDGALLAAGCDDGAVRIWRRDVSPDGPRTYGRGTVPPVPPDLPD